MLLLLLRGAGLTTSLQLHHTAVRGCPQEVSRQLQSDKRSQTFCWIYCKTESGMKPCSGLALWPSCVVTGDLKHKGRTSTSLFVYSSIQSPSPTRSLRPSPRLCFDWTQPWCPVAVLADPTRYTWLVVILTRCDAFLMARSTVQPATLHFPQQLNAPCGAATDAAHPTNLHRAA